MRDSPTFQDAIHAQEGELRRAIHRHGKDSPQARAEAINLCQVGGLDPYYKTAVYQPIAVQGDDPTTRVEPTYSEEWQRIVALYAASPWRTAMSKPETNPELDRALARLMAIPKPPTCADCGGVIEAPWWSYCAMCGKHLAAGNEPNSK